MSHGNWAFVGLGTGTMACYLQSGQTITYYEINPVVAQIAKNPRFFTFLQQCAPQATIVLGDARMKLRDVPDGVYNLIVLDAFSADSIPIHLMTKEALALYLLKLAPGGVIAFHISNRYLDLEPPLDCLARDGHLFALTEHDLGVTESQAEEGKFQSIWVVMARNKADLTALATDTDSPARWTQLEMHPGAKVWTDDYSNLLSTIHWSGWSPH
jgi:spermidine synthase